jgi:putative tryptophan/tyrosine transport system substrate-binding protein
MPLDRLRRRDFIALLGGAAAWPLGVRGQQGAVPVVGYLSPGSQPDAVRLTPLREGLRTAGYVEDRNLAMAYGWAEGHYDRLPGLAADLVRHPVTVIVAVADVPARVAKAAASVTPIVFATGSDPVMLGLVDGYAKPGSNVTGATWYTGSVAAKRLGLLHDLVPTATTIGLMVNPDNVRSDYEARDAREATRATGQQLLLLKANTESAIDAAFTTLVQQNAGALVVSGDAFFGSRLEQIMALAARHAIPTLYSNRTYVTPGGLVSYGASPIDAYRQAGTYAGRILKGERPANLPVMLPTRFELVINLKTAKALGLTIPAGILAIADEVIE